MRVVLIYRSPQVGDYSIEELFHAIAAELGQYAEVIEYQAGSRSRFLLDAWRLWRMKADIYHITGGVNYLACLLPWRRTVLTVHDIGHFLYGLSGFRRWLYKWIWLQLPLHAARVVTTVSSATRDCIQMHLGLPASRMHVIPNCHSHMFQPVSRPFRSECPVILQVGTKPYKNVPRLIEALREIPCRLVLIGRLDEDLRARLSRCQIDFVNLFDLSREELVRQYADCDIVSFVSLGEGFGVPIIEAQAVGRPLITSNVPPLSDVAGDGACLVDPQDVTQIRQAILRMIHDPEYRQAQTRHGHLNVARFSPSAIGKQYFNLYGRTLSC